MAIYHLSIKTVSRSAGRSATAAAAYRAAARIEDERTGLVHDYRHRGGVLLTQIVLPDGAPAWAHALDRAALWNAAEATENRKNSVVAREWEAALPSDLPADARQDLALALAREVAERHQVAVDVALHAPGRKAKDDRNHHVHLLATTRRLVDDGLGEKTRELDDRSRPKKGVPSRGSQEVTWWRQCWEELQNTALKECGSEARVDCRTLREQGILRAPQRKIGPAAWGMESRSIVSDRGEDCREQQQAEQDILDELARVEAECEDIETCLRAERGAAATEAALRQLALAEEAMPPPPTLARSQFETASLSVQGRLARWRQKCEPGPPPPLLPASREQLANLQERLVDWLHSSVLPAVTPPPRLPPSEEHLEEVGVRMDDWMSASARAIEAPPPAPTPAVTQAAETATQLSLLDRLHDIVAIHSQGPPPDRRLTPDESRLAVHDDMEPR